MQIDFTKEELVAIMNMIYGPPVSPWPPIEDANSSAAIGKLNAALRGTDQVTGHFSWRMPDGGRQVNCAVVLVDGKIIDDVAVADTDAGLVAKFDGEMIEGRVEVWVP